ncbi:glycosyltransferase [Amycolatopsis granulosa]|uniref:glycosyltransferase n=1 Tax=Amycolatopsis granulosa TaxID=185684 RepID=UPI0014231A47|nr:glycosyltransferase involved in cell wall biosynthesis [Amycolatopsis granulosa]
MIFVQPGDATDPELPSGGNVFDRRISRELTALGRTVREVAVPGSWPHPDAGARARLGRELAAAAPGTLVVLDGLVACGVPEIVVPHAARLRLMVLVHMPLGEETGADPALDARERATLRAARAVVTTSARTAERLRRHHGLARVEVVVPGTDPAPLSSGDELLCVGSLTPHKGQDVLVEALAAVADLPWRCRLTGPVRRSPAFAARVRRSIDAHRLSGRVTITGPLTGPRLERAYARAGLLVLPSWSETYGMVMAEALARGIPVLTSAPTEVLGEVRGEPGQLPGLVVPPGDASALAHALRSWLTSPPLRQALRDAARSRRDTLPTWETAARVMARILGEPEAGRVP